MVVESSNNRMVGVWTVFAYFAPYFSSYHPLDVQNLNWTVRRTSGDKSAWTILGRTSFLMRWNVFHQSVVTSLGTVVVCSFTYIFYIILPRKITSPYRDLTRKLKKKTRSGHTVVIESSCTTGWLVRGEIDCFIVTRLRWSRDEISVEFKIQTSRKNVELKSESRRGTRKQRSKDDNTPALLVYPSIPDHPQTALRLRLNGKAYPTEVVVVLHIRWLERETELIVDVRRKRVA